MRTPIAMNAPHTLALLPLLVALPLCGCASKQVARAPELPFHVAVVPIQVDEDFSDDEPSLALVLDEEETTRAVADALGDDCFARVSVLSYPEGADLDAFRSEDNREQRNRHWVEQAREKGADLLLECVVFHGKDFRSERNEKFWLNLPLFILGGPFGYWVNDVTYYANAELSAEFYELDPVYSERYALDSTHTTLMTTSAAFDEVTMDFADRMGLNAGSFAASFVVPAGLLARRNKRVRNKLQDEIIAQLADRFRQRIVAKHRVLEQPDELVNFYFEPDEDGPTWSPDGELVVDGEVILKVDRTVSRMEAYRLSVGDAHGEWYFGEPTYNEQLSEQLRGRYFRYPVHAALPVAGEPTEALLEIEDGSDDGNRRSFTFSVPPRGAGS